VWPSEGRWVALITTLKGLPRSIHKNATFGIPFKEFCSVIYKVQHAFMAMLTGEKLLSPIFVILGAEPPVMFLQKTDTYIQQLRSAKQAYCSIKRK